jgi:hypothetical protein
VKDNIPQRAVSTRNMQFYLSFSFSFYFIQFGSKKLNSYPTHLFSNHVGSDRIQIGSDESVPVGSIIDTATIPAARRKRESKRMKTKKKN